MDLGLHVDTTHVGWSLTENNEIVRMKGQDMIGVDVFQRAETAEEKRLARAARRNKKRKRVLLNFVKDAFQAELCNHDPLFLDRVKQSGLFEEDGGYQHGFFQSKEEAIAVNEKYPTIYHLRRAVMDGEETDIRLVFLAVLHCFKNRGHMRLNGVNPNQVLDFDFAYNQFRDAMASVLGVNLTLDDKECIKSAILSSQSPTVKAKQICNALSAGKNTSVKIVISLLCGANAQLVKIFPTLTTMQEQSDNIKPASATIMTFDQEEFDADLERYYAYLSSNEMNLILSARKMYDWSKLSNVLNEATSISSAMIQRYDKHKADLAVLKKIYRYMDDHGFENCYKDFFCKTDGNPNNYACYVGDVVDEKKLGRFGLHRSTESFYKELFSQLSDMRDSLPATDPYVDTIQTCLNDIAEDNFLPKQKDKRNAIIPNVLTAYELSMMLNTAAKKYSFLNDVGVSGQYAVKEELLMLHKFTLPYWIGPVNDSSKYAWAVHKEPGVVYPWNIAEKIDFSKTRHNFIRRMTNECALLAGESVLPEESFYNRKMQVLDELNGIRVNGEKLPVNIKQEIFSELSMKYKTVTQSAVMSVLYNHKLVAPGDEVDISGFTKKKLNRSMGCNIAASAICTGLDDSVYEMLAEYIAVFKGDYNEIMDALKDAPFDSDMLKKLLGAIKDSGWGLYSKKALTEVIAYVPELKQEVSLLDALFLTQARLTELLGSEYEFSEAFIRKNEECYSSISASKMIRDANTTPMVKRSLYQMMNVLKEIKSFSKQTPDTVYLNIYVPNNMQATKENIGRLLQKVFSLKTSDPKKNEENKRLLELLNSIKGPLSKRQQLYFLQRGRCLYTGEDIPYESIFQSDSRFNLEHIYPKSKVMDDKVTSNLCLVSKAVNQDKDNSYPLKRSIQAAMMPFWGELLSDGLMTQAKFNALTATSLIPLDVRLETIDKVLVEHRKTALLAGKLIQTCFPGAKICFVSNKILSDFINKHNLQEFDVINYFPEARKSYYVQIVGRVWYSIFTDRPKKCIFNNQKYSLNVWNYDSDYWKVASSLADIKKIIANAHIKETYMVDCSHTGAFSDSTNMSAAYAAKGAQMLPYSKTKQDVTKYGGKTSIKTAFFSIVRTDGSLNLVTVPVYKACQMRNKQDIIDYLITLGNDVEVIVPVINRYSILNIDGIRLLIRSISGNVVRCGGARTYIEKDESYLQSVFAFNRLAAQSEYFLEKYNISKERNQQEYQRFCDNYSHNYEMRPNNQIDNLLLSYESFCTLSVQEQCKILENMYGLVRTGSCEADLSLLSYTDLKDGCLKNMKQHSGVIGFSSCLDKFDHIMVEHVSHTGLYNHKIVIK